jgi:hypothetical protein
MKQAKQTKRKQITPLFSQDDMDSLKNKKSSSLELEQIPLLS